MIFVNGGLHFDAPVEAIEDGCFVQIERNVPLFKLVHHLAVDLAEFVLTSSVYQSLGLSFGYKKRS
jgi:hypothetical protein